jgi:hypothetical protein
LIFIVGIQIRLLFSQLLFLLHQILIHNLNFTLIHLIAICSNSSGIIHIIEGKIKAIINIGRHKYHIHQPKVWLYQTIHVIYLICVKY